MVQTGEGAGGNRVSQTGCGTPQDWEERLKEQVLNRSTIRVDVQVVGGVGSLDRVRGLHIVAP